MVGQTFLGEAQKNINWRDGRAVECGGLENRYSERSESRVRIPLSPPAFAKASAGRTIPFKSKIVHSQSLRDKLATIQH